MRKNNQKREVMKIHTRREGIRRKLYRSVWLLLIVFGIMLCPGKIVRGATLSELMEQYVGTCWNDYYYGEQCKGFANYMWYRLYDVTFIGCYDGNMYYIPNVSGGFEIGRLDFGQTNQEAVEKLLKQGVPGDFIQVRARGRNFGHSMIYVEQDERGVTVFDCNFSGGNRVQKHYMTWGEMNQYCSAISMYRSYRAASGIKVPQKMERGRLKRGANVEFGGFENYFSAYGDKTGKVEIEPGIWSFHGKKGRVLSYINRKGREERIFLGGISVKEDRADFVPWCFVDENENIYLLSRDETVIYGLPKDRSKILVYRLPKNIRWNQCRPENFKG